MPKAADSLQQSRVDDDFTPAEIRFIEALMEAPQYRWLRVFGSERDPSRQARRSAFGSRRTRHRNRQRLIGGWRRIFRADSR